MIFSVSNLVFGCSISRFGLLLPLLLLVVVVVLLTLLLLLAPLDAAGDAVEVVVFVFDEETTSC